ncbi:hypothetical protein RchiOBHm_Chr1g0382881 [Rosa chinensis]|uniref:Uncharacterized protein n=1 Tax=Rosa chinensis TaxID=74649 RepID=A0A2P6SPI5_ROSCH|nr:hypothetical protein RchiOBHm_Chr1g0382881 [Rosa chinensis]
MKPISFSSLFLRPAFTVGFRRSAERRSNMTTKSDDVEDEDHGLESSSHVGMAGPGKIIVVGDDGLPDRFLRS